MDEGIHKRKSEAGTGLLDDISQEIDSSLFEAHSISEFCIDHWYIGQGHRRLR